MDNTSALYSQARWPTNAPTCNRSVTYTAERCKAVGVVVDGAMASLNVEVERTEKREEPEVET